MRFTKYFDWRFLALLLLLLLVNGCASLWYMPAQRRPPASTPDQDIMLSQLKVPEGKIATQQTQQNQLPR